ncbi:MAG: hypothetical protein KIT84_29950 [Labilithrix sp.]|nr:hypothetical protein [Labilithrix sp.]MCW5815287.1 hypothetical protein [Labilithrix sp.]
MIRFGATDVRVRRRPRVAWIVALALAVPALLAAVGLELAAGLLLLGGLFLFFMLPAVLYEDSLLGERNVPVLSADRAGIAFGKRLVLRRERIDAAFVEPLADGGRQVHLWGKRERDDLVLFLDDEKRAALLLDALGLTPDAHAARFVVESAPLRSRARQRLAAALRMAGGFAIAGAVVWAMGHVPLAGFSLVPLLWLYGVLVRFLRRHRRVTLGSDALVVEEEIPFAAIAKVSAVGDRDAHVERIAGDRIVLRFDGREAKDKRATFIERLQQSVARAAGATHLGALLAPGGRSSEAWLAELRRMSGGEGYRGPSLPPEELWRVVLHPGAEAGARAGALAALVAGFDEDDRVRVGTMSESTVRVDLRAALAAAAREGATDDAVVTAFLGASER